MLGLAAPFDLRQHLVDDGVFRERFPEGHIQALQQIGHRFLVPTYEGDADFLSLCGESGAAYGWYLTDCDLATGVIEESLDMFEGRDR